MGDERGPLRAMEVVVATGAGGDISATFRPPVGEVWDVYCLKGYHTGAAGLACQWYVVDALAPSPLLMGGGGSQPRAFFSDVQSCGGGLLRLYNDCYITFQVVGIAGALTVTGQLLYERITGILMQGD
jgi:hypothetical protein